METVETVRWAADGSVRIIDQRELPARLVHRDLRTVAAVCDAIATLAVRGAPAIGVAGAMGLAAALAPHAARSARDFGRRMETAAARIRSVRPTAVNLAWAVDRTLAAGRAALEAGPRAAAAAMRAEADAILHEDRAMCRRIGEHGLALIPDGARVLTHCNAGALATAGTGTALAPVYAAVAAGRRVEVYADETRPLLQGSRLTAWELERAGIPVTVLADNMAASLMRAGRVDLCIVGADRIAANGDVANKIGTYALAIVARHHGVPFYVAAPTSTFDAAVPDGCAIAIEQRAPAEVTGPPHRRSAPEGARVYNPAFDVTPAALVSAIVSDRGVHRAPYDFSRPFSTDEADSRSPAPPSAGAPPRHQHGAALGHEHHPFSAGGIESAHPVSRHAAQPHDDAPDADAPDADAPYAAASSAARAAR